MEIIAIVCGVAELIMIGAAIGAGLNNESRNEDDDQSGPGLACMG